MKALRARRLLSRKICLPSPNVHIGEGIHNNRHGGEGQPLRPNFGICDKVPKTHISSGLKPRYLATSDFKKSQPKRPSGRRARMIPAAASSCTRRGLILKSCATSLVVIITCIYFPLFAVFCVLLRVFARVRAVMVK